MIKIKLKSDLSKIASEVSKAIEYRRDHLAEELAEAVVHRITMASDGKIKIDKVIQDGKITVTAYGPDAVRIEREKHPFENTANMLHGIIKTLKW